MYNLKYNVTTSCCGGVGGPNEVEGNPKLRDAYEIGRAI